MFKFRLFLILSMSIQLLYSQDKTQLIWKVKHPVSKAWIEFGTHGSVQEMLWKLGELPDPYYGENEQKYQWIEKYDWEFESEIPLDKSIFEQEFIELEFPNIDTYASVFLNGHLLFEANNFYRPYRIEVKQLLSTEKNILKVIFKSPVNFHREAYTKRSSKLPAPNDVGEIAVASMSRKPQYQFGWDWALRMNTMGFAKAVQISAYSINKVILPQVETIKFAEGDAWLNLHAAFLHDCKHVQLKSTLFGNFDHVDVKHKRMTLPVVLKNAERWWPVGKGEQKMYSDTWKIYTSEGEFIQELKVRFGVKTSELIQEKDAVGTSFYFKINDLPVFCKGGNYIPQSIFPSQVTDADLRKMVDQMAAANFNTVRIWGGGYYPDEAFYEACDEAGIMVWQDFMFACAMYPGDEKFMQTVEAELDYQIPRISAHPSVIYFNGNNEVDVAWKNWGFQLKYMIGPKTQRQIEKDYDQLFKKMIPSLVKKYSSLPYEHTSPLSNWGKDEFYTSGTQHYWGVWHGKDPIEDFGKKSGRFNAEYGFQSFPEYSTLLTFSTQKDWDLASSVMKAHQKSYVGNGMILKQTERLYGKPKNFEDFIYYSQLTQAQAVGIAISSHRIQAPRCMGTLYWQVNDCWAAPTWSSMDYFWNWKALHYRVQNDYEPEAVLQKTDKIGEERYFFLSDSEAHFTTEIRYEISDFSGRILKKNTVELFSTGDHLQELCLECQEEALLNRNYFIQFFWKNAAGEEKQRSFVHRPISIESAPKESVSFRILSISETEKTAVIELVNTQFVQDLWLYSTQTGIRFSSNFESYLPGKHQITLSFDKIPQESDFNLKWW